MNVSVLKVIRRAKRNFYAVSIVLIMLFVAKNVLKTMNHLKLMGDKMIVYRFDKERFNKNADKGIKRILSKHLEMCIRDRLIGKSIPVLAEEEYEIIKPIVNVEHRGNNNSSNRSNKGNSKVNRKKTGNHREKRYIKNKPKNNK